MTILKATIRVLMPFWIVISVLSETPQYELVCEVLQSAYFISPGNNVALSLQVIFCDTVQNSFVSDDDQQYPLLLDNGFLQYFDPELI